MSHNAVSIVALAALACSLTLVAASSQTRPADAGLPPGHPPLPTTPAGAGPDAELPPGHPPVTTAPDGATVETADVRSPETLLAAYYESLSGPAGEARAWGRFRGLFLPGARLVTVGGGNPIALSPQQFADLNRKYFEVGGYFETSIHQRRDEFGHLVHVFSTYESRRASDAEPYTRGINSFQLLESGGRWWIVSVVWERERAGTPVPSRYLPPPNP